MQTPTAGHDKVSDSAFAFQKVSIKVETVSKLILYKYWTIGVSGLWWEQFIRTWTSGKAIRVHTSGKKERITLVKKEKQLNNVVIKAKYQY